MAYMAHLILALNLSGELLDPPITWVFANKSCLPCVSHQLELMRRFLNRRRPDPALGRHELAEKNAGRARHPRGFPRIGVDENPKRLFRASHWLALAG